MTAPGELTLSVHGSIEDIDAASWDACARGDNPFVSHAFLAALERSQSVGGGTGWQPAHAVFRDAGGMICACAPAYMKSHSYGEYVFDQGWARAIEQAGGRYYPKLQVCSPFSPVPGPRILRRPEAPQTGALAAALVQLLPSLRAQSLHLTFCTEAEYDAIGAQGFLQRLGVQYHWHNQGYGSFEDFLGALASRKRKSLRRERRDAQNCGLVFHTLQGDAITPAHWDAFYHFYLDTSARKWGNPYLTRSFFTELSRGLGDRVVLMLAEDRGEYVAAALNLMGRDTLYGRNWGGRGDYPFLHFELCYYRAIDFAIAQGLARVEAGAQGEHKIQRGYVPVRTFSTHWIAHQGLSRAVEDFLVQERAAVAAEITALAEFSPYRQDGPSGPVGGQE